MDSAALHIKFNPLIKQLQCNSNCYIEVLPEISQITNLDKIDWNNNEEEIEFNIPMLYKIIIKKGTENKRMDKVYHSCVDLLPTELLNKKSNNSVMENIECNTKLMKQLVSLSNNKEISAYINRDDKKNTADEKNITFFNPSIKKQESSLEIISPKIVMNNRVSKSNSNILQRTRDNGDFYDRTSYQCLNPDLKITRIDKDVINDIKLQVTTNEDEKPIFVSPIRQISTVVENTLLTLRISQHGKRRSQDISYLNDFLNTTEGITSYNMNSNVKFRIEQLVNHMKNEIMPFNRTLDEIVAKCSTLSKKLKKKIEKSADEKCIQENNINNKVKKPNPHVRFSKMTNRVCLNLVYTED